VFIGPEPRIENLRDYPAEAVEKLRDALRSGVQPRADANRANFFEVDDGNQVFYIHVSPVTGKVLFLATWALERQTQCVAD
jgi:hypothetical protein